MDEEPLKHVGKVGGVALEIWTMDNNYYFDNILLANAPDAAESARATYWEPKKELEVRPQRHNPCIPPRQKP